MELPSARAGSMYPSVVPGWNVQTANVGLLIIRIGFWGLLIIIIVLYYTSKPYSNF